MKKLRIQILTNTKAAIFKLIEEKNYLLSSIINFIREIIPIFVKKNTICKSTFETFHKEVYLNILSIFNSEIIRIAKITLDKSNLKLKNMKSIPDFIFDEY